MITIGYLLYGDKQVWCPEFEWTDALAIFYVYHQFQKPELLNVFQHGVQRGSVANWN